MQSIKAIISFLLLSTLWGCSSSSTNGVGASFETAGVAPKTECLVNHTGNTIRLVDCKDPLVWRSAWDNTVLARLTPEFTWNENDVSGRRTIKGELQYETFKRILRFQNVSVTFVFFNGNQPLFDVYGGIMVGGFLACGLHRPLIPEKEVSADPKKATRVEVSGKGGSWGNCQ